VWAFVVAVCFYFCLVCFAYSIFFCFFVVFLCCFSFVFFFFFFFWFPMVRGIIGSRVLAFRCDLFCSVFAFSFGGPSYLGCCTDWFWDCSVGFVGSFGLSFSKTL